MLPTLTEIKKQCRVEHDEEDDLIEMYLSAIIARTKSYLNRNFYEHLVPKEDKTGILFSDDMKLAMLLTIAVWYDNRSSATIPRGYFEIMEQYRIKKI